MSWAINDKDYSQRRACRLIGLAPKVYRYRTRRSDDGALRARLRSLALARRRFGYWRLYLMLRREGMLVNHKKVYRLYRKEKLTVRKRGGRKRALGTRAPLALPEVKNHRWSLDFVWTLCAMAAGSACWPLWTTSRASVWHWSWILRSRAAVVARELDLLIELRGKPRSTLATMARNLRRERC